MEYKNPNWVEKRAECNMPELWAALCRLMMENVERINAVATAGGWGIAYSKPAEGTCRTTRYSGQEEDGECRWQYENNPIRVVFTMKQPDYTACLTACWDAKTCQCEVVVRRSFDQKEEKFPQADLGKALQYILEPFFFPSP